MTLNYINGLEEDRDNWDIYVCDREGHYVSLSDPQLSINNLDELSAVEMEILDYIWKQYGHMDQYPPRDFTHKHCLEWGNPLGSSAPIPYKRVFKFLGKANSLELAIALQEDRELLDIILESSN